MKCTTTLNTIKGDFQLLASGGDAQGELYEAQQYLGMNLGAFYYLVETGKIKRLTPPGKKRGFYSKHQIEKLAKERLNCMNEEGEPGAIFMKTTLDDIYEECELATLMLNGHAPYGVPTYKAWLAKNPATNFILRDQGRIVAFMLVIPVKQRTIERWINGEIREWEISAEDVLAYIPETSVECIIMSMVTTSDVDRWKRREYGLRLIRGFLNFLHALAKRGIMITRFYAISTTPDGNAILKQAKFEERGLLEKRIVFELNTTTSQTRMAEAYRAVLKSYKSM
jgi:hypothetical protein